MILLCFTDSRRVVAWRKRQFVRVRMLYPSLYRSEPNYLGSHGVGWNPRSAFTFCSQGFDQAAWLPGSRKDKKRRCRNVTRRGAQSSTLGGCLVSLLDSTVMTWEGSPVFSTSMYQHVSSVKWISTGRPKKADVVCGIFGYEYLWNMADNE